MSSRTQTSGLLGLPPTQLCSCVKHILVFLSITSFFGQKEASVHTRGIEQESGGIREGEAERPTGVRP